MPGKQSIPIWLTIVIGIIASFIGGYITVALGYRNANGGVPWTMIIVQVVLAAIGVLITVGSYTRRGVRQ